MADLDIVRWIRSQNEEGAVALARALIFAEAGLHGLELDRFTVSGRVKARDQGIDGRTYFPNGLPSLFPLGACVWQIKSGTSVPPVEKEFDPEKHKALLEAIQEGHDYVLFWTNDPVDPSAQELQDAFIAKVQGIRASAKVYFLFAEAVERMCYGHLGVLAQASPYPLSGLVNLMRWGYPQLFEAVEWQPDEPRDEALALLRSHVTSLGSEPYAVHVVGDGGVGKSRLVYQALLEPGIQERVLVAPDASRFDRAILTHVANSEERTLVLVVDECEAADRSALDRYTGMAQGRIRLITIGKPMSRALSVADARRIDVPPLAADASKLIAQSVGLNETDADLVARYTEGYPGLAFTLAKSMRFGDGGESLAERVRSHEELGLVLASLVPTDDVPRLAVVALFDKLGVEDDLSQELSIVCSSLEVDEDAVRRVLDQELGRFVAAAGRFRSITPRLFAIWLATRLMAEDGASLRRALGALPESLRDRIVAQMQDFAGDPVVAEVLKDILQESPFSDGTLAGVDESAARLIHVAAIAAPHSAMTTIRGLLDRSSGPDLDEFRTGRQEIVWALEILLWFGETFQEAASALLELALHENARWSNNATGTLEGIFRIYLGGTSVPYGQRISWARDALAAHGDAAEVALIGGLKHALDSQETRTSPYFGGRSAPPEWRPKDGEEEVQARAEAWDLLLEIAESSEAARPLVASALAAGARTAFRRGLTQRVFRDWRRIGWDPASRAELGTSLGRVLRYEPLDESLAERVRALRDDLTGGTIHDRLRYAVSVPPWKLIAEEDERGSASPALLVRLASEVAATGQEDVAVLAATAPDADPQSLGILFEKLASETGDREIMNALEAAEGVDDAALAGALRGLSSRVDQGWIDEILERWVEDGRGSLAISAIHLLEPSATRARLACSAIDVGGARPAELGRLLYGAWVARVPEAEVLAIATRVASGGGAYEIEHALGMIEQWLENQEPAELSETFRRTALALLEEATALGEAASPMVPLYRLRVVRAMELRGAQLADIAAAVFRSLESFPDEHDLELIDLLVQRDANLGIALIIDLLTTDDADDNYFWRHWMEDAKVVTRVGNSSSADRIVEAALEHVAPEDWHRLIPHIDFDKERPDPVLVALLDRLDDERLRGISTFHLMYPRSGWSGAESSMLRNRQTKAREWLAEADSDTGFAQWLQGAIQEMEQRIHAAELSEAERGW